MYIADKRDSASTLVKVGSDSLLKNTYLLTVGCVRIGPNQSDLNSILGILFLFRSSQKDMLRTVSFGSLPMSALS